MSMVVEQWFDSLSAEHVPPLFALRKLILDSHKQIEEEIKWRRPCYTLNRLVCYLHQSANHVTIGFYQGAQLDDPDGLLEGDGKKLRHIKIRPGDKIRKTAIKKLIASAIALDQS